MAEKIKQKIITYSQEEIINTVENIINDNFDDNYNIFFPSDKKWFKYYIDILKKINKNDVTSGDACRMSPIESLIYYKKSGYSIINNILYHGKFPLIYIFDNYYSELLNKNKLNKEPIYIFPSDLQKIQKYNQQKIIDSINNIDNIFLNNKVELDNCILFRGLKKYPSKLVKNVSDDDLLNILTGENYTKKSSKNFNKNNEILCKGYSSFSFSPIIAKDFASDVQLTSPTSGLILILKINKKDHIPGLFLSNVLFGKDHQYNKYSSEMNEEMEVLLSRNIKIKIIEKKEVYINKTRHFPSKINNIYNKKGSDKLLKTIQIIYAETLPYEKPSAFKPNPGQFTYLCKKTYQNSLDS